MSEKVKGGFPPILIKDIFLKKKAEQGYSNNIYSIKDMIKSKKVIPILMPNTDTELNKVNNTVIGSIKGIPISMIIG